MYRRIFAFLIIVCVAAGIYAADISVDYIDGILDLKENGRWYEIYAGDCLENDSVVKLDNDSYAELSYGSSVIKLTRPGTYQIAELIQSRNDVAAAGRVSLFTGKFKTFVQEDHMKTQSTVGGVRAAEAETVSIDWMSSESTELIADGLKALSVNNYDDAELYFQDALDFAADSFEEREALYYLGWLSAMKGDYSEALVNLDRIDAEDDLEFYTDYYILKSQILIESFAYEEAFNFLNGYNFNAGASDKGSKQELYFMIAVAGNNSGNKAEARNALNALLRIDADSDIAEAAKGYKEKI